MDLARMAADLAFMVADLPSSVTVDGVAWSCTAGTMATGMDMDEGGLVELPSREYVGAVSGLSITPTNASVLMDSGKTYRVISVNKSEDGLAWSLGVKGDWR